MVTQWGMSVKLGPRTFGKREELVFLGKEISEQRDYSDKVAEEIDEEIHTIIDNAYRIAKGILSRKRPKLAQIAERLMADETIEGQALDALFDSPVAPGVHDSNVGEDSPRPKQGWKPRRRRKPAHFENNADSNKAGSPPGDLNEGNAEPNPASP